jgi:hypothetical protein
LQLGFSSVCRRIKKESLLHHASASGEEGSLSLWGQEQYQIHGNCRRITRVSQHD